MQIFKRKTYGGIQFLLTRAMSKNSRVAIEASYNISYLMTEFGYPHTVGKNMLLAAIQKVFTTIMKIKPEPISSTLPLSSIIIKRRIDEIAYEQKMIK